MFYKGDKMKQVAAFLILILLLTGCKVTDVDEISPISKTVIQGDYELTVTSARREYSLKKLLRTEPLDITATLTYVGSRDEIAIWRSFSIGRISLFHENGMLEITADFPAIQIPDVIKKGDIIAISDDYTYKYHIDKLIEGEYIAEALVHFQLAEKENQKVIISIDIPFTIIE